MKSNLLSESSIAALRQLLGKRIYTIFAPTLDVAGTHLAAPSLSMLIDKDCYFNFSCERFETSEFLNDSWLIFVERSMEPIGIARNEMGALLAPCTINTYRAQPILLIEVFDFKDAAEGEGIEESVHYDRSIVFRCAEGRTFCISCMLDGPGIATYLHFSESDVIIEKMIEGSTVRLVLVEEATQ